MKIRFLCISFLSALCFSLYSPIANAQKLPQLLKSLTTLKEKLGALNTQLQGLKRPKPKPPAPTPPSAPQLLEANVIAVGLKQNNAWLCGIFTMFHYEQVQTLIAPKLANYASIHAIKQDVQEKLTPVDFMQYQNEKAPAFFDGKECDFLEKEVPTDTLPVLIHKKAGPGFKIPKDATCSITHLQVDLGMYVAIAWNFELPKDIIQLNATVKFVDQQEKLNVFLQQETNSALYFICTGGTAGGAGHHFLLVLVKFGALKTLGLIVMDSCEETGREISGEAQPFVDNVTQAINKPRLLS